MKILGTTEGAFLLGISVSRLRVLLKENRVKDTGKVGRYWGIPLFNGIPKVQIPDPILLQSIFTNVSNLGAIHPIT